MEALLSYYCHVRERGATSDSPEGQRCVELLQCITEQNVLLLGMMADASNECMMLTRFMDRDTFDVGCVHVEHDRINHLFLNKACLTCDGYTKVALEFLKRPRVLETVTLALTTIGSIARADKTQVMQVVARSELGEGHHTDLKY